MAIAISKMASIPEAQRLIITLLNTSCCRAWKSVATKYAFGFCFTKEE